jgi:hypothetical protein
LEAHLPRIDYLAWLTRVVGWDIAFPLAIGMTAASIGWVFGRGAGVDVVVLAGLPAVAFLIRLGVGLGQINSNACGQVMRGLQVAVLTFGLFAIAFLDFFVALAAFNPNNGVDPNEIALTVVIGTALYLAAATFAMYPGRTLDEVDRWGEGAVA